MRGGCRRKELKRLTGKYEAFAEYFGNDVAEGIFKADISTAKKKDKMKRLKKKRLELPASDVGTAYQKILTEKVGIFSAERPAETVWNAERIIVQIQTLEMEI